MRTFSDRQKMLSLKVLLLLLVQRQIMAKDCIVYDLCIVGAGMFGSAAARHASAYPNLKVILVGPPEPTVEERPNREIFGNYYDAGRITSTLVYFENSVLPALTVLTQESTKRYRDLERMSGIKFYTPIGFIYIVQKKESLRTKMLQAADSENFAIFELPRETFERRYPYIKLKKNESALFEDNGGGVIDPRKLVEAQKKVAKLQGCDIIESVVSGVTLEKGFYKIKTEHNQTITAKRIIVAPGTFINVKTFDVLKPLQVTKMKATTILLKLPKQEVNRLSALPPVLINGRYDPTYKQVVHSFLMTPVKYPDGNYYIKTGLEGHDEEEADEEKIRKWYSSSGNKTQREMTKTLIHRSLPGIKYTSTKPMVCVYCMTPSGLPYIDRISPTLTLAVGGNAASAKASDEIGKLAAELSITGNWASKTRKILFEAMYQD